MGALVPTSATGLSLGAKTLRTATWKSPSYCWTLGPTFCGPKRRKSFPSCFIQQWGCRAAHHTRYEGVNASPTQCWVGFGLGEVAHPLNPNAWESGIVGLWIPGHPRLQSKDPVPKPNPNQNDNEWRGCIYIAIRLLMTPTSFSLLWPHIQSNPSHAPHKLYWCSFPPMRLKHLLLNTYTYIKIMGVQGSIGRMMLTSACLQLCSTETWSFGDRRGPVHILALPLVSCGAQGKFICLTWRFTVKLVD